MPAKRLRSRCSHVFTMIAVFLVMSAGVKAQTGSVTLKATVSEAVSLSVMPNSINGNLETDVVSSGNTVRLTLSAAGTDSSVVRVPLLVRSNSSFKISATVESKTAVLTQLSIVAARATGTLVSPQATNQLKVPRQFDLRGVNESTSSAPNLLDNVRPLLIVSGPRVSLGGTLESPNNALQIMVVIRLRPQPDLASPIHLTFVAAPE